MFALEFINIGDASDDQLEETMRIVNERGTYEWLGNGNPWSLAKLHEMRRLENIGANANWSYKSFLIRDRVGAQICGMVYVHPVPRSGTARSGRMSQIGIFVAKALRGNGIAQSAINYITSVAKIPLCVIVRADNAPMRALMEQRKDVRERKRMSIGERDVQYCMYTLASERESE